MTRYDRLPIWKDATRIAVLLEEAVRRFPRYYQCSLGADLGREAYAVANVEREGRANGPYVVGCLKHGLKRRAPQEVGWPAASARSRFTHIRIGALMHRKPFALLSLRAMLLLSTVGTPALATAATCTAGIPNPSVIETTPTADFVDHGDGTVTHTKTGLMWKQCVEGLSGAGCATGAATLMLWSNALNAANTANAANGGLGFANHTDWRLPNAKELQSIVESCGNSPSVNQTAFPATPATQYFWSSTSVVSLPGYAWAVTFNTGAAIDSIKGNSEFVRLVRGGQPVDSFDALSPSTPQFVYTPVEPCRIMDTRNATLASGVQGPIAGGALKQIPGFVSLGWQLDAIRPAGNAPSDCGLTNPPGTSIKAVAIVITILNPNFDAFLGVSDVNNLTTTLSTVALNYTHGQGLSTMYIVPQIAEQQHLLRDADGLVRAHHLRCGRLFRRIRCHRPRLHDGHLGRGDHRRVQHRQRRLACLRRRLHAEQRQLRQRFDKHEAHLGQSVRRQHDMDLHREQRGCVSAFDRDGKLLPRFG